MVVAGDGNGVQRMLGEHEQAIKALRQDLNCDVRRIEKKLDDLSYQIRDIVNQYRKRNYYLGASAAFFAGILVSMGGWRVLPFVLAAAG